MFSSCAASVFLLLSGAASAQQYTISTFAGGGLPVNVPATSASLGDLKGVALDSNGNAFIPLAQYHIVVRWDATTGLLTLVAGNGTAGFSGDNGPATSAQLNAPQAVSLDPSGNLYIVDYNNGSIRKVSNGVITTLAGGGSANPGDNGPATNVRLRFITGVAADSAGNVYIAENSGNGSIRKVSNG